VLGARHGALDPAGMLVRSAGSSMDRASDYGSEGWGFDSLPARRSEAHRAVDPRRNSPQC
jgi:hypothetical protein